MKTIIVTKVVHKRVAGTKTITIPDPRTVFTYRGLVSNMGLSLVLPGFFSGFHLVYLVMCLVVLVVLFRKKKTPKPIKKKRDKSYKISNQKYIIRKRDPKGRLRHIETVIIPPDEQHLRQFGPGNYCILTSKPKIALWKNISIPEAKVKKEKQSKTRNKIPETPIPEPTSNLKVEIEPLPYFQDITPPKQIQKSGNHLENKGHTTIEKGNISPYPTPNQKFNKRVANIQTYVPKISNQIKNETIEIKDTVPDNRDLIRPPQKIRNEEINKTTCSLCKGTLGVHAICEFCCKSFCEDFSKNCLRNHLCEKSMPCHFCYRRIQIELVEVNEYCHNFFCSQRCMRLCYNDNKEEPGCETCLDMITSEENREEEFEEEDENMDELNNECEECGTIINESMSFCPECGTEIGEGEGDESECEQCGTIVNESDRYCIGCGTEFNEEDREDINGECDEDCSTCTNDDCDDRTTEIYDEDGLEESEEEDLDEE